MSGNQNVVSLVDQCKEGFHVSNNKDKSHSQVTELLEKINKMVKMNRGSHYTMEMFQEAERAIEEEKNRILGENKEKRNREDEKLNNLFEGEALEKARKELREKHEREAREKAERNTAGRYLAVVGSAAAGGAAIGAAIAGPVGAAVGAIVGGVAGAIEVFLKPMFAVYDTK